MLFFFLDSKDVNISWGENESGFKQNRININQYKAKVSDSAEIIKWKIHSRQPLQKEVKSRRVSQTGKCWRAKFARNVSTDHCSTVVLAKEVLRSALSAGRRSNFEPGSCRCSRRAMLSNRSCGELSQTYGTSLELNYLNQCLHLWPSTYLCVLPCYLDMEILHREATPYIGV